jgi:hypothetical protein
MHALNHLSTPRTFRRVSAEAIAHLAATDAQAARLAALGHAPTRRTEASARFWTGHLIDRLSTPISRLRE